MKDAYIVKGYQGIMDLDLSSIDPKFHKEVINQHYTDIAEYKRDQQERPPKLRYENTIARAYTLIEIDRKALEQVRQRELELQNQHDKRREEDFNRNQQN